MNCPEAYLSLLTFCLSTLLFIFANYCRHFCLREICSFPANLLFLHDPAVKLLIKVNTICLVCICKNKDSTWKQMGNVTIHGVSASHVFYLRLLRRKECFARGEQGAHPSFISCLTLPVSHDLYGGHHYVKQQRWNVSTVYVKQQMVELHNLKCYMYTYIYISTSLR